MNARTNRWIIAAAIVALILGAILSRVIDPGVRVEKIMLTTNTPALRLFPATAGPHPVALLAHGNGGSKEMLFRFGEALAAAGFDCYSVDQAGFGESPQPLSHTNLRLKPQELERVLGGVDVFIGHSMGGSVGAWGVREGEFRPKLFIGVGFPPVSAGCGCHDGAWLWSPGYWRWVAWHSWPGCHFPSLRKAFFFLPFSCAPC